MINSKIDIYLRIGALWVEILRTFSRIITGKLLTDEQIRSISKNVAGTYFEDWLAIPQRELEAERRVEKARRHIAEASNIIMSLQGDLETQAQQLNELSREIDEKKNLAERYAVLAKTNQEVFGAFKAEMEEAVRGELIAQAERGKRIRRVITFIIWSITLILGAALGAYFEISFEDIIRGR